MFATSIQIQIQELNWTLKWILNSILQSKTKRWETKVLQDHWKWKTICSHDFQQINEEKQANLKPLISSVDEMLQMKTLERQNKHTGKQPQSLSFDIWAYKFTFA